MDSDDDDDDKNAISFKRSRKELKDPEELVREACAAHGLRTFYPEMRSYWQLIAAGRGRISFL